MTCKRCQDDPQPDGSGSPRRCAFDDAGDFTPENWYCATIEALLHTQDVPAAVGFEPVFPTNLSFWGPDESMQIVPAGDMDEADGGFIVLNRYKQRGCTSSAMHVGDFWPARPLTLELAEATIKEWS